MRWMIAAVVFGLIVSGIVSNSLANEEAGKEHQKEGEIGMTQPRSNMKNSEIPYQIQLLEPQALGTVSGTSVALRWRAITNASVYHVQVAKDPMFKWLLANEYNVKDNSFEVSNLEAGHQYFWRVAGRRPDNSPGWTHGPFSFSSFSVQ